MERSHLVTVAAVNDYEFVAAGVAKLLCRYRDRLAVRECLVIGEPVTEAVDVALYDTYGRSGLAAPALRTLVGTPKIGAVAVFSLDLTPDLIADGRAAGARGFISKGLPGEEIVEAIVRIAAGESVVASTPSPRPAIPDLLWPGKDDGLTERESQVLVLVAEGLSNREVAAALYLSAETVKGYLRQIYSKLGVRNRVQAAAYVHRSGTFARRHTVPPHSA